jgi:sulfite exporter TauE/SafE
MITALFISSFLLGIGGSLHCMGMCGPLALAVPFAHEQHNRWLRIFIYYLAKAFAYATMGAFSGLIGKGFMLMNWQQSLSLAAGIFIILWVLLPKLKSFKAGFIFDRQFSKIFARMQNGPAFTDFFALGFLNGLLPCGLVYTALAAASVSGTAWYGFTAMFIFGLGTAPALIAMAVLKNKLSINIRKKLQPLSMVISLSIAVLLIIRGLNLGIPYLSPRVSSESKVVSGCCAPKSEPMLAPCH